MEAFLTVLLSQMDDTLYGQTEQLMALVRPKVEVCAFMLAILGARTLLLLRYTAQLTMEFIMVKCRLFYLPGEFTFILISPVYIPLDAKAKVAMNEIYAAISKQQPAHLGAALIVGGDFNHSTST